MKRPARSSHHLFLPCIHLFFSCLCFFLPQQRENSARLVHDLLIWKYSDRQQRHLYLLYGNKKAVQDIGFPARLLPRFLLAFAHNRSANTTLLLSGSFPFLTTGRLHTLLIHSSDTTYQITTPYFSTAYSNITDLKLSARKYSVKSARFCHFSEVLLHNAPILRNSAHLA